MRAILLCLLLSGCTGPVKREVTLLPVGNMTETCDARKSVLRNGSGCIQKDADRCVIFTKNRNVSYDDFGALVRKCIE